MLSETSFKCSMAATASFVTALITLTPAEILVCIQKLKVTVLLLRTSNRITYTLVVVSSNIKTAAVIASILSCQVTSS